MKLATAFLIIGALQISLLLFAYQYADTNPFLTAALNPTDFNNVYLITEIGILVGAVALGSTYIGSFIMNKPDLVVFGTLILLVVGWLTPIVSLWRLITVEGFAGVDTTALPGTVSTSGSYLIAAIVILPLIVMAIWSVLTWWRSTFEG